MLGEKSVRIPMCHPDNKHAELQLNQGMCVETRRLTAGNEARRVVGIVQILAFTEENNSDLDSVGSGLPAVLCMKHVDSAKNRKFVHCSCHFRVGDCC